MQFGVEDKRQALLRIIVGRQIAFLFRTIRRNSFAWVVNPAHDVIVVGLLADAAQVGGKVTADLIVAFTNRVTRKTSTPLEKLFAVTGIALRLSWYFGIETFLPEIRRDGLNLFGCVLVRLRRADRSFVQMPKAPERRHLGAGTKRLRILQPNRYPFLAQLHAHVLQVWSNFLLILHQVFCLQVQLIDTCGDQTIRDAQTFGVGQQLLDFVFAEIWIIAGLCVGENLFLVRGDLILELASRLPRGRQPVCLTIETFVTMTTHATALLKKVAAKVQCSGALRHAIARVTLLAARFGVLLLKHRPQPETMASVTFDLARSCTPVAPVTTGTTKLLRVVDLQDLPVWMADKRTRQTVRLFTWSIGSEIGRG